jgi:hypothetical protein
MKKTIFFITLLIMMALTLSAQEKPEGRYLDLIRNTEEIPIPMDGPLAAPVPAPSEKFLAFTKEDFKGIYLFDFETGKILELSNLSGSGFGFEWSDSDLIAFRASLGDSAGKHIICVGHTDGIVEVATPLLESVSLPLWENNSLVFALWDKEPKLKTVGPASESLPEKAAVFCAPEGRIVRFNADGKKYESLPLYNKTFFLPRYSGGGERFLLHCLDDHIYLGSIDSDKLKDIGGGSSARFARDGKWVIFEKTRDDGHRILASDLFLYDIESGVTYQLTNTPGIIEREPSMAGDGHTVFWEQNGKLMRGVVK